MTIYKAIGINGEELYYTFSYDGQRYIYKQRKKSFNNWIHKLMQLLKKAKYEDEEISYIISIQRLLAA